MRTHTFQGRKQRHCDQLNHHRYRLLADGSIIDKQNENRTVGYITSNSDLDVLFKMHRGQQQKFLIQAING